MTHVVTQIRSHTVAVTGPDAQKVADLLEASEAMSDLLDEVSSCFTREDDLPDGLLGRIDALLLALPS